MKSFSNTYKLLQKRLLILIVSITFLFFALFLRLGYVQIVQSSQLKARASDQWTRELPLEAERGRILDINGNVLAENKSTYSVYVRPAAMQNKDLVINALVNYLGQDREYVTKKLSGKPVSDITICKDITQEQADAIKQTGVTGIYFSLDTKRVYPYGQFLTQVLGYVNIDGDGQAGLEAYYNKQLKGTNGMALTQTDIRGKELEDNFTDYIPPIAGLDVTLTIDANIQMLAETAVKDAYTEFSAQSASAIVYHVKSGQIAAMSSYPSFDLNNPPRDDISLLNALSKNSMIVDIFEPGSTFKVFTTSAAIEEGKTHAKDTFYDPGYRLIDGERIKCWRTHGHGSQTLEQALNNSCNSVFMDLAMRLETQDFYDYMKAFGFNAPTGIDFYSESRGIMMPQKSVRRVDLARMGFGQAIAVTPLQLVAGMGAVVNNGRLMQPYFVQSITSREGLTAYYKQPKEVNKVISDQTSEVMRDMLEGVVRDGSGKKCFIEGYRIGGKTGTAQKYKDGIIDRGKYVSSFIGFAPADDPEYVTLMVVNEPSGYLYYGSLVAGPYARNIFEGIFIYKKMQPQNLNEDLSKLVAISMPDLRGLTLTEAVTTLAKNGLQYEIVGSDGVVLEQTPPPQTIVYKGSIVLIRMSEGED